MTKSEPSPLDVETFLSMSAEITVFDARTAAEHAQGRIPQSLSLPVFNEEERAAVGATYKQISREEAVLQGCDFFGAKMRSLVETARDRAADNALVYCWRGGMRSAALAWLLNFYGIGSRTLEGGYKNFRRYAMASFNLPRRVIALGGRTGAGKTVVLAALKKLGEQVIDLEAIARHKGSAFGAIGMPPQVTNEQFENELGLEWRGLNADRRVWLEDESQKIGGAFIPQQIYGAIRTAPTILLDIPIEKRISSLIDDYGFASAEQLAVGIRKIERRLGGHHAKLALDALADSDLASCFRYLLNYYDRAYDYGVAQRNSNETHHIAGVEDPLENARAVIMRADMLGL